MFESPIQKNFPIDSEKPLPALNWKRLDDHHLGISFVALHQPDLAKFFYEMVSKWLIPGRLLEPDYYCFTRKRNALVVESVFHFEKVEDCNWALQNIPFLQREILQGARSVYHAKKILEMKGLSPDEKMAFVHGKIGALLRRFPTYFDSELFIETQQSLFTISEEFKASRKPADLTRIIYTLYLFRKSLEKRRLKNERRRHVFLKCKRNFLATPLGIKTVISLYGGISYLKEHEILEERHVAAAIRHVAPELQILPGSFVSFDSEKIHRFYVEVTHGNQNALTEEKIRSLEVSLPIELRNRVELLVPPLFMPRNEEEIMRNLLLLAKQLRYLRDLPQMCISLDKQDDEDIFFTIVLVRIHFPHARSITQLIHEANLFHMIEVERTKTMGMLRKKYPKEGVVLRARLPIEQFLRTDFFVDLFQARGELVTQLEKAIGEVRDYNGGMIAKQRENFIILKRQLGKMGERHHLFLQNFFHAIFPVHMSSTTSPDLLEKLFLLLLEVRTQKEGMKTAHAESCLLMAMKISDEAEQKAIFHSIETLSLSSGEMLSVQLQEEDQRYLAFIYSSQNSAKQEEFLSATLTFAAN